MADSLRMLLISLDEMKHEELWYTKNTASVCQYLLMYYTIILEIFVLE